MKPIIVTPSDRIVPLHESPRAGALTRTLCAISRLAWQGWKRYFVRQSTIKTLVRMNDRVLRDIGIERGQIPAVAAELAAHGRDAVAVARFPAKTGVRLPSAVERECA